MRREKQFLSLENTREMAFPPNKITFIFIFSYLIMQKEWRKKSSIVIKPGYRASMLACPSREFYFLRDLLKLISWSRLAPERLLMNWDDIRCLEQWRRLFTCPWILQSLCLHFTIAHGDQKTRNPLACHLAWLICVWRRGYHTKF